MLQREYGGKGQRDVRSGRLRKRGGRRRGRKRGKENEVFKN